MNAAPAHALAARLAVTYAVLPAVEAVALAGSQTTGAAGPGPDIDLYVYTRPPGMRAQVEGLLRAAGPDALARIDALVDGLDEVLRAEHLYPAWPA